MTDKNVHEGHRKRIRNRFLVTEGNGFEQHELLEILLFYSISRGDTNETAHRLIKKFGNIEKVLSADPQSLMEVENVGKATADFLKVFSEICSTYLEGAKPQAVFNTLKDSKLYLRNYFKDSRSESCVLLNIGADMNLIEMVSVSPSGIIDGKVTSKDIMEILIRKKFYRMIVGINRPDYPAVPTNNDYAIIRKMSEIAKHIDIMLDDFVICGKNNKAYSMCEYGGFSLESRFSR